MGGRSLCRLCLPFTRKLSRKWRKPKGTDLDSTREANRFGFDAPLHRVACSSFAAACLPSFSFHAQRDSLMAKLGNAQSN
jgi:hypothetical protein